MKRFSLFILWLTFFAKDVRTPSDSADLSLEDVHEGSVHTILWSPLESLETEVSSEIGESSLNLKELLGREVLNWQYLLVTAGMDKVIKVYDLRKPDLIHPLYNFSGHIADHVSKVKYFYFFCINIY